MKQERDKSARMRAITISREYGSGGGEIAQRLAQHLRWSLIDHEIVVAVAQELGVSVEEAQAQDEHTESLTSRILSSLQMIQPTLFTISPVLTMSDAPNYQDALNHVVEGAIATGNAIIVGRGAQVLLASHRDVLHVRIVAPLEMRISYVMHREGISADDARARIQVKDHNRTRYLQNIHHRRPDESVLYDLTLNTGILALDQAVELISMALQQKATRLSLASEELGPGADVEPYSQRPGSFGPPASITKTSPL